MARKTTTTSKKRKTTKRKKTAKARTAKTARAKSAKKFRTYNQALKYLCERTNYEKQRKVRYNVSNFNLDRINALLSALDNPQHKIETVHIAGTKGKGSTAVMLAKMLEANGYKVGVYSSPHVLSLHERIMVNSEPIKESEMVSLMNRVYAPVEKIAKNDEPSFFEIMTAIAFLHFANCEVDIAIIETGLGGRLDSTNVLKPKVIGITSLSMDHTQYLGDTLAKIAKEKAGIFKPKVPVVTVKQQPDALKTLRKEALALEAPLMVTGRDISFSYRFETSLEEGPHTRVCLSTPTSKFEHVKVPLHGTHQAINCGLALALLDRLKEHGYEIDHEKAEQGLTGVELPGRMEMIYTDPRIMIDAAHNADSIEALMHAIGQNIPYDSMVVIFGCNEDKDVNGMLEKLQFGADKVIFTRTSSPKSVNPQDLADKYSKISGKMCQSASCLAEALQLANNAIGREDLICITGSFYLIGQAKARFRPDLKAVGI